MTFYVTTGEKNWQVEYVVDIIRNSLRQCGLFLFAVFYVVSVSGSNSIKIQTFVRVCMEQISWNDFEKVELRVGKILEAEVFKEARNPAYILHIDFGEEIGVRKSSAQITEHYTTRELVGKMVVGVVNFPKKQIGPLMSECLTTGFYDEAKNVVLCVPDKDVPLGAKLL